MNGQRGQLSTLIGRTLLGLAATAVTAVLLAPTVAASPMGDAEDAMMAAWEKAGGDTSTLGVRKGDVYPIGDGFALDFAGGKMFFTPATGAKYLYGPLLDKYESLGGAADSDLGFPTINEVPGLAGPDSRVSTFSAADNPVIFWTPEHGAFVVRGALNAAWDKLGSSGGVLGAPVGDETYDGEVTAQKFSGGEVSWNRATKEFTTVPAVLAEQLKGLQVAIDPSAAINMAWRAAGGAAGPLGAKKGGQYPIGGDGIAQDFVGGKVFFSPATGANAVEGEILAKYESLGGPVSSDLGFPIANETDGGFGPSSRIVRFSAADKPVIFWTPDHGAFVVRGAMVAAWDKLRGPNGKLGAPVGDQTVDGDVVSQKFTGGMISWNRAKNTFTTDPANLAPLLSGLQVSGQNQPSTSAMPPPGKKFTWHWWWLGAAALGVLLVVMVALVCSDCVGVDVGTTPLLTTMTALGMSSTVPPLMETGRLTRTSVQSISVSATSSRRNLWRRTPGPHRGSAGRAAPGRLSVMPSIFRVRRATAATCCPAPATSGSRRKTPMRWTPRRHPLCRRPTFPKSVPISLFLSEWFRRLSFRKPLFRKQWRLKRCRPMSTLPILLTLGCRRRLYPQLKTEAGGTRPQNRRNRRVRACARQFICRSRTHTRCRTAIPSKPV